MSQWVKWPDLEGPEWKRFCQEAVEVKLPLHVPRDALASVRPGDGFVHEHRDISICRPGIVVSVDHGAGTFQAYFFNSSERRSLWESQPWWRRAWLVLTFRKPKWAP